MRTEAVDLDIGGHCVRVISHSPEATKLLRTALADHVVDDEAEPGFVVKPPSGSSGLHLLVDRSGFLLARTRTVEACVAVLASHLAGLLPPPPDTVRLKMRAFVDQDSATAVLAAFPLFATPPLTERQIERASSCVIDRLAVDVTADGAIHLSPSPWPSLDGEVLGHAKASDGRVPIRRVLLPRTSPKHPSYASVVAFTSSTMSSHLLLRSHRLDLAELLASLEIRTIGVNDRSERYAALKQ